MNKREEKTNAAVVRQLLKEDPNIDTGVAQRLAVYRHPNTQKFMSANRINEEAMFAYMMYEMPLAETMARALRKQRENLRKKGIRTKKDEGHLRKVPQWYLDYLRTSHWDEVKVMAKASHGKPERCSINEKHRRECWHHNTYRELGSPTEFTTLIPLCNKCHRAMRVHGPRVPDECPRAIRRILELEIN